MTPDPLLVTIETPAQGPLMQVVITDQGPATAKPQPVRTKTGKVKATQPEYVTQWDPHLRMYRWEADGHTGTFVAHPKVDGAERIGRRGLTEAIVTARSRALGTGS